MIKHSFHIIGFGILLLALAGCKKDTHGYAAYSDDYRFYVYGKVSGIPFQYSAGKGDHEMAASFELKDSVIEMTGRLLPHGNVPRSGFEIRIRGNQRLADLQSFDPSQNLSTGAIALRDATGFRKETDKFLITLSCDSTNAQYSGHKWIFPDGTFSYAYSLEKEVSLNDYHEYYPVRLATTGSFNCQSEVYHQINLIGDCDAGFDVSILPGFQVKLSLKNVVGTVEEVVWYHNNIEVSPSGSNSSIYLGNTGMPHKIKCEVHFADGCTKVIERQLSANFAQSCLTDFNYQKKRELIFDPNQMATVELIYYDDTGKSYTSHYSNAQGEFSIESFVPYKSNDQGHPTQRIYFTANALLKSTDGSTIQLNDCFGSFAVAHP